MPAPLRCLITAGPTREHLDPVRFLSNGSSGKMGYAIAASASALGWTVDLVSGPVALPCPAGVTRHPVVSADDMLAACTPLFPQCDLLIAVAAVADYRPAQRETRKQKKAPGPLTLDLVPTVDVLKTLSAQRAPHHTVVGFAAETNDVESYARRKLTEKRLDWIVANDVSAAGLGMDADDNAVLLIGADGTRLAFGPGPKTRVADWLLTTLAARLRRTEPTSPTP